MIHQNGETGRRLDNGLGLGPLGGRRAIGASMLTPSPRPDGSGPRPDGRAARTGAAPIARPRPSPRARLRSGLPIWWNSS